MGRKFCRRGCGFSLWIFFSTEEQKNIFEFWPALLCSLCTYVWSLFYFGRWLLAFSSSICHAEFSSASHREPLLVLLRGQILKQVQDDGGWCEPLAGCWFLFFDRRTKEHIWVLAGTLMKLMYLCLVSFFRQKNKRTCFEFWPVLLCSLCTYVWFSLLSSKNDAKI